MKYIITIMLCAFLMSCSKNYEGEIIEEVTHFNSKYYIYTTSVGSTFRSKRLIYQVGDTLRFFNDNTGKK